MSTSPVAVAKGTARSEPSGTAGSTRALLVMGPVDVEMSRDVTESADWLASSSASWVDQWPTGVTCCCGAKSMPRADSGEPGSMVGGGYCASEYWGTNSPVGAGGGESWGAGKSASVGISVGDVPNGIPAGGASAESGTPVSDGVSTASSASGSRGATGATSSEDGMYWGSASAACGGSTRGGGSVTA